MGHVNLSSIDSIVSRYTNSKFDWPIPDQMKCLACRNLLRAPVQTICGCRYCIQCIENYLVSGPKMCLGDSNECQNVIKDYRVDRAITKDISLLKVKCLFDRCKFEDFLKNMSAHFEICRFRMVVCSVCSLSYVEEDRKKHDEEECLGREVECTYCLKIFTFFELHNTHLNVLNEGLCEAYVVPCPYNCGVEGDLCISIHIQTCTKRPQKCPLSLLGCDQLICEEQMTEHIVSHSVNIVEELQTLKETIRENESKITTLEDDKKKQESKMASMKNAFEMKFTEMDKNIKNNSNSVGKSEIVHRKGKYLWKIENFSHLKENAKKGSSTGIMSNSFYTDDFGYKMCLKIYPYGDGIGKGTHLSVFFVIMKGEYDDVLSWPFKNKVTLTLIDDLSKSNNHTDTFKPDARSICYQQPEEEFNVASGSPKFISFIDLSRFIKHDSLYLQINVLPL